MDVRLKELASLEVFAECTSRELERVAGLCDLVHFPAGRELTREGRTGRECFIIADGRVEVTIRGKQIAELGPGSILGEMAIIEQEPRAATATALEPTDAYVFTTPAFNALLDFAPGVTKQVLRTLSQRIRDFQDAA